MTKPMTDEQTTEILEMAAEAEHAPRLKAEVARLRKENKALIGELPRTAAQVYKENIKLRKVVEMALLCVEKDKDGAYLLIVNDYDIEVLQRLDFSLRDLDEEK